LDLLEIWHYIARDNIAAANRVSERLEAETLELLAMPGKGHRRADVKNPQYRFWRVYRYSDTTLTIIRIVHGRRNFRQLLRKSP
jgi:toxin ParE1/3/4